MSSISSIIEKLRLQIKIERYFRNFKEIVYSSRVSNEGHLKYLEEEYGHSQTELEKRLFSVFSHYIDSLLDHLKDDFSNITFDVWRSEISIRLDDHSIISYRDENNRSYSCNTYECIHYDLSNDRHFYH